MSNLVQYEKALEPMIPTFKDLLAPVSMEPARLIRTVLVSIERTPQLQKCTMQSVVNSATTFAVLGLEVDGVTGQGFLLPFRDLAQPVIGYKGYNTLAWRAGYTINGSVVREGEEFDYMLGSEGFVRHKPLLGGKPDRQILAAYACATAPGMSPIVQVLDINELLAVKAKSPGAKRSQSPWNDPSVGFAAMCEKTAKRRLARAMPLNVMQRAATMEERFDEMGQSSYIRPDGNLFDGSDKVKMDKQPEPTGPIIDMEPIVFKVQMADGSERTFPNFEGWKAFMLQIPDRLTGNAAALKKYRELNGALMLELKDQYAMDIEDIDGKFSEAILKAASDAN